MKELIIPCPPEHAVDIVPLMSDEDRLEMEALGWSGQHRAQLIADSLASWSMACDGVPMFVAAVSPYAPRKGVLWMLSTPEIKRHSLWALRKKPQLLALIQDCCDSINGICDTRHPETLALVRWIGFTVSNSVEVVLPIGEVRVFPYWWRRAL